LLAALQAADSQMITSLFMLRLATGWEMNHSQMTTIFFHSPFGDRSILHNRIATKDELHRFTKCDEGWGNYLLAGLLKSLKAVRSKSSASNGVKYKSDAGSALGTAIKVATEKRGAGRKARPGRRRNGKYK
jgi:hypothetical protein